MVGMALLQGPGDSLTLGVAHANGAIHAYNAATGHWRLHLKVAANVAELHAASR